VRATVLNDPALTKYAGRFAWLSINAEDARNADIVGRLDVDSYPTFLILDGGSGRAALRWSGTLTVPEFERFLADGERAIAPAGGSPADEALARADRLNGEEKATEAAAAYAEALRVAPPGWTGRDRAVEALLAAQQKAGQLEACVTTARREVGGLDRGPAFAGAAATGLACATDAPKDAAWRAAAIPELRKWVEESLDLTGVLADDRSSAYGVLVDLADASGDAAAAKATAERWMRFLEAEGVRAPGVEARAALDSHRVSAALALGDPARAVPALLASEHDLPGDYNPPARLAVLYREMGKNDEALAASQRALDNAYGARKLRIYDTRADIYAKMGDKAAAKRTLEDAVRFAQTLPESQRPARFVAALEKKAAAIGS
jgi:tetratricopeptide (TPR) repeat protein